MFHHREYVEYIFLEEGGPVFVFEVILAQQYLDASLYAETAKQGDFLKMKVFYGGVQGLWARCFPIIVAL